MKSSIINYNIIETLNLYGFERLNIYFEFLNIMLQAIKWRK